MKSVVEQSHDFLYECLHKGAVCIDATLGHGKDTKFFLEHHVKKVYGFEIQKDIIEKTTKDIDNDRLTAIFDGHQNMDQYISEDVDAIIFNFGYCPNTDSMITTTKDTSLTAVKKALELLKKKGRMALVMYPHQEGQQEARSIEEYLNSLDPHRYYIEKRFQLNQSNSPYLIDIEKL